MKIKYREFNRVLDGIDSCINNLFKLFLLPVILVGVYAIYDWGQLEVGAIKAASLAKEYVDASGDSVDFKALQQNNADVIAWLQIPDTNIDFPVMQAKDNYYYLSHDFEKNYAVTGGIFLDYRNRKDFSDGLSIIYGHRMSSGRMFSDVGKFEDKEFFNRHQEVAVLYTPGQKYKIRFVAFASVYGVQGEIYNVGAFRKEEAVAKILENASIVTDDAERGEKYILLSTCSTKEQAKRDVLLGILEW